MYGLHIMSGWDESGDCGDHVCVGISITIVSPSWSGVGSLKSKSMCEKQKGMYECDVQQ
ncbi:hypothetical protein HYC85_009949 [Camellia sinensis]|uniref:Uncharacterized protein n=1 Tax=Camellia sinensis TaxID=4442 RepID=A0A7J7HHF3_CAMSI|nr:hypothetical protein HYC85_009949 [Camellia sinensis]